MKLEVNGKVYAENADADDVKDAVHELDPNAEAIIVLSESEGVFLQAAGIPAEGYVMGYQNAETSEELTSKNQALKQAAVTRTLTAYVQGKWEWRNTIGWQPTGAYAGRTISTWAAMRRGWPVFAALIFFIVALLPLVMGTKAVLEQIIYKPACEQRQVGFDHFQHGSGNGSPAIGYTPARCWYTNGDNIALGDIVGSSELLMDVAGRIAEVVVPLIIIVVIEVVGFSLLLRGRKRETA